MNKLTLFLLFLNLGGYAQQQANPETNKYWILLKDKKDIGEKMATAYLSPATVQNRLRSQLPVSQFTDLPVSGAYQTQLRSLNISLQCQSRWLNAVSAYLDETQLQLVKRLPFVREIVPINNYLVLARNKRQNLQPQFATVMSQVGAEAFVEKGLTGKGIAIGVIDAGFFGAMTNKALDHLFNEAKIKASRDFINPAKKDYFGDKETDSDYHGSEVLSAITGFDAERSMQYGMATQASFYLARTDHGVREFRGEEDYWVSAIEWMDSLGVRLVNTSLGYATGFSNPKENYKPEQMDGKTSLIGRAAQIAAHEKGMLVVVSAGNEGEESDWKVVSTPADAQGVLSVGATRARTWDKIGYSSIGPEFLSYLKPNVACSSPASGTSFSAPVICGFAACLMQAAPDLTGKQLIDVIERSAHLYPYGNNYVGYGVPQAARALRLLADSTIQVNTVSEVIATGKRFSLKLAVGHENDGPINVFHKKSRYHVIEQELLTPEQGRLVLEKLAGEVRTTIDLKNESIEVIWR